MDVGLNLSSINYWSTEEPFIDRFHIADAWHAKDAAGNDVTSTLILNARGDITNEQGLASINTSIEVDPVSGPTSHEYVLTYDGTAGKIGMANVKIVSQTAGQIVFDYVGGDTRPDVFVSFSQLDPNNPIGNVHLVRADQQDLFNAGEIFNPAFVAKVAQMGVVRMMDWGNTNDSEPVSWATRTTLADAAWSKQTTTDGVPIEAMVQLANEAHVDLWYNVPTTADNTYVTNALTYIRDHLAPGLKVQVEYSNEVWNTSFAANTYAQTQANALWGNGSVVDHGANIYYGYRSAQIADIAHTVFSGAHAGQLDDILSGQAAGSGLMTYMLQGIAKAGLGSASALFDDYAIAPYFGAEMGTGVKAVDESTILGWANSGAAGMDAAFHELEFGGSLTSDMSLATIHKWLVKSEAAAQSAGLDLVAYEGGISLGTTRWDAADKPTVQDFFNRLLADPRMGEIYAKMLADFKANGGTEFVAFNDVSRASDAGSYGALGSIYDDGSQRFDALVAAGNGTGAVAHPIATTPGLISGTTASDALFAGATNDTVDGGDGNDVITGSSGSTDALGHLIESDLYMGGAGADTIVGGIGNDHIYGNELTAVAGAVDGADSLSAGAGNDYVQGNAGADTIDGNDGNDRLYGGADADSILGSAGNDYLQGNKGNDTLSGGSGDDTVHGGADDDRLSGDAGNDQLFGDAGNDTLTGGAGIDTITGGTGNDKFVFSGHDAAFATSGVLAWATDEVADFASGSDKLALDFRPTQLLHGSADSVSAAMAFATQQLQAHAGQGDVAAVTVGSDTYMFWDSTGHGGAIDSAIKVDHVQDNVFSTADFV
jgi:Ca2+-binding RTX toxin-like protein